MNEQDIYIEAIEQTSPEKLQQFLDEACGDNPDLRQRVEALLRQSQQVGSFLEHPPVEAMASAVEEVSSGIDATILHDKGSTLDDDESAIDPQPMNDRLENGDEEIPLGYLEPSAEPDSLGRLGHYEVLEVIGRGAFGIVLRAYDEKLQRVVAIKVLAPELAATSPARKRFKREATSSASVRHENVVAVHAVEDDPIPYLVMEYIPGKTLQQRLDETGPLDILDVLRVGKQIADGLAAAHAEGLIHRDIKPGNILLEGGMEERVKITDFGLARTADDASMTQSGMIAGTPMYMAPEQAHGRKLDHRADLFSLGSVLYQMLSGRPPFRAPTTMAVLKRVTDDTPRPIREIIPEVPEWMCDLVSHLHAKEPGHRFESAKEVSDLLARCAVDLQEGRIPEIPVPEGAKEAHAEKAVAEKAKPASRAALGGPLWKVAAAILIVFGLLGIGEATNLTDFSGTVIRLATGSGTLVIESYDPGVKVAINGEEITITGGGVERITLRPGDYTVTALKNGKPVKQELVSITRNGRTVVRMSLDNGRVAGTESVRAVNEDHVRAQQPNYALSFDGNSYVSTPVNLPVDKPFTIEAWATPTSWEGATLFSVICNAQLAGVSLELRNFEMLNWGFSVQDQLGYQKALSSSAPERDRPVHLAGVFDGSHARLFVNGELMQSEPALNLPLKPSSLPLLIGANPQPDDRFPIYPFSGMIDEVRFSNVARYTGNFTPATRFEPDGHTLALYHFDEGSGDIAKDTSGNGHHGKIVGAKWVKLNTASPSAEELARGESVDLIALIDKERDFLDDQLRLQNGKIITPSYHGAPGSVGMIPYGPIPANYDIELQLQRVSKKGAGFNFGILVGGRQVLVGMDCGDQQNGFVWGLDELDAQSGYHQDNPTNKPGKLSAASDEMGRLMAVGETNDVTIQVRENHITARLNGETLIDWTGDPERLGLDSIYKIPKADSLFFVSQADFIVHTMTLIPRGAEFAGGEWIDVIPLIDPEQDKFDLRGVISTGKNEWRIENGELEVGHADGLPNKLVLPIDSDFQPGFECELEVTRRRGPLGFHFNVPTGNGQTPIEFGSGTAGVLMLKLGEPKATPVPLVEAPQFQGAQRSKIRIRVDYDSENDRIRVWNNDVEVGDWTGDLKELVQINDEGYPPNRRLCLWVGGRGTELVFHRIRLRMLDGGTASALRPLPDNQAYQWPADAPPPAIRHFKGGESIDLISLIDPEQDKWDLQSTGKNEWRIENGELLVGDDDTKPHKLNFPLDSDWDSFELEIDVTRRESNIGFCFNIPTERNDCPVCIGWSEKEGVWIGKHGPHDHVVEQRLLKTGVRSKLRFEFLRGKGTEDQLIVYHNDEPKPVGRWTGNAAEGALGVDQGYPHKRRSGLYIGEGKEEAVKAKYTFHSLRVRMLEGGTASTIRPLPLKQTFQWPADAPPPAVAPFDAEQAKAHQEAWAKYLGVPVEKEIVLGKDEEGQDVTISMVLIPAGEYLIGSNTNQVGKIFADARQQNDNWTIGLLNRESPEHRVRLTRPFYMAKHEISQAQWQAILGSNPSEKQDSPSHPVENVSWDDTQTFIAKLNEQFSATAQVQFSLPTEAQWESACRAGSSGTWYFGDSDSEFSQYGWIGSNAGGKTRPVGALKPNPYGLHDVYGNVWEWCADYYSADYYTLAPQNNPAGPSSGAERIVRGGHWLANLPIHSRSAARDYFPPDSHQGVIGFRISAELPDFSFSQNLGQPN